MWTSLTHLPLVRSRREMWIKISAASFAIVAMADAIDFLINLYTQPDRIWPSFIQTTLTAAVMSLLFLILVGRANLRLYQMKERFEALALTDLQTGLLNRRGFFARLDQAKAMGADMTLGIVDIDYFKRINDSYGHMVGDYVIAEVGRSLRAGLDASHLVGRVGGEEFAVALRGLTPLEAREAADRLRRELAEIGGPQLPPSLTVTASVGLARIGTSDVMTSYGRADRALYAAKHQGRNITVSADLDGDNVVRLPIQAGEQAGLSA